ncbi:MAG: hypothetical protein FJ218_09590 [Ignavibacteria bacterium]|nr:hypothetical protein [Ignavibacteria bacterium]
MNKNNNAVGYVRCSTDLQEDSPEQQKKEILSFAEQKGYNLTEWYVDFGKSGTTFEQRLEFQRLKRCVENKPSFSVVICYDESRWGRAIDSEENTYERVYFKKHGVNVLLVKTSIDPQHEFAPMLKAFEGVQASQYSKKLSELTLRGAKNNGIYSSGGTAPYGYKRVAVNTKNQIERELNDGDHCVRGQEKVKWVLGNSQEVEVVKRIFDLRKNGKAYITIVDTLNKEGISCPKRGRWRNKDQKWSINSVKSILENPVYYGARVYNKNSMSKIIAYQKNNNTLSDTKYPHWKNSPSEWIITESAHDAIIEKELFERVNKLSENNCGEKKINIRHNSPYLLSSLIFCSHCGFPFQGQSNKAKNKNYFKYIDSGYHNKRVCAYLGLPKEQMENFAINSIKEMLAENNFISKIESSLQNLLDEKPRDAEKEKEYLQNQLHDVNQKIAKWVVAFEELEQLESAASRIKELETEKKNIQEKIESLQQSETEQNYKNIREVVIKWFESFEANFERATIIEKKDLIHKLVEKIIVNRNENEVQFFVRRVPLVQQNVANLYKKENVLTEVVSTYSSGDRI